MPCSTAALSRRDDLEALGYVLLAMHPSGNKLPWEDVEGTEIEKDKAITAIMVQTSISDLCSGLQRK